MLDIISNIKQKWSVAGATLKTTEPFRLRCSINDRTNNFENPFFTQLPAELGEWWSLVEDANLFEDIDYGQWGLKLLNETEAFEQTNEYQSQDDYKMTDIIIGNFIGDLDLVIISIEESYFGKIIISTPIDTRKDWYFLNLNFREFLEKYIENEGDKFWEINNDIV